MRGNRLLGTETHDMKHALLAASLVLVAGATVGCGDGDTSDSEAGAPTDASTEDFCGTFEDFYDEVRELGADAKDEDVVKALKGIGEKLDEVGTPEDISDDAREGFELTVEAIDGLEDDASQEDIAKLEDEFSEDETKKTDAFDDYLAKTCEAPAGDE